MREIQIVGIVVSLLLLTYIFWKRKRRKYTRTQSVLGALSAFGLLTISISPSAGDLIAGPLKMDRWNAVLFVAFLVQQLFIFYLLNQGNRNSRTTSRLIEALASSKYSTIELRDEECDIMVVIPAYNEAENIGDVLQRIPRVVSGLTVGVLVAVDGGTDNTEDVARNYGASVVVNPINRGGGAALRAGYEVALKTNTDIIVTLDADGQHLPEEIPQVVAPILSGEADFVNGSRVLGSHEAESQVRVAGVFLFNWLISILMFERITDASNAFRAIRSSTLSQLTLYQDQFHTSELLIEAMKENARVIEVPITIRKRQSGETKKPPSLRYGWGFTKAIVGAWLR